MDAYQPLDFYSMNDLLTQEQQMIASTVRKFVTNKVLPTIADCYRHGKFPRELIPELGELGMLGANINGYGCTSLGPIACGLINLELERGDGGLRSFVSVQSSLCMWPIHEYGTKEQKGRWLPLMAKGEVIGCFGLTEADHGSNPGGMITTARRDGSDYIINGAKMWITNGSMADVAVVWAKLDGKVRGFLVEKGMPGYTVQDIHNKLSLRASATSELAFDDVRVPKENYLPGSEIGLKAPLNCLNQARYGIAWGVLGSALACFDEALQYSKSRIQFNRPIAEFQLTQSKLATMATGITQGQLLALRLGQLKEEGKLRHFQVSMAKMNNVAMALDVARTARSILGANGICDDYQCARHMANLESVFTYEGTHDIHTLIVGKALTGMRAFD